MRIAPLAAAAISGFIAILPAWGMLRPDKVHVADSKKTQAYVKDGLIVGGDHAIDDVLVKDIRRASNAGFERVVIDLAATRAGETAAIPRPPYYQVAVTPDEKRVVLTLWGKPRLGFDPKKVSAGFRKSHVVDRVELLPRVDQDSWTFVIDLKAGKPVEAFELTNPVRIILDIRS